MAARFFSSLRRSMIVFTAALAMAGSIAAPAQIQPVDPDKAIDGDLSRPAGAPTPSPAPTPVATGAAQPGPAGEATPVASPDGTIPAEAPSNTYKKDDVLTAAEGVFGKGAKDRKSVV